MGGGGSIGRGIFFKCLLDWLMFRNKGVYEFIFVLDFVLNWEFFGIGFLIIDIFLWFFGVVMLKKRGCKDLFFFCCKCSFCGLVWGLFLIFKVKVNLLLFYSLFKLK